VRLFLAHCGGAVEVVVAIMSEKDGSLDSSCCSMKRHSMAVVYEATKEGCGTSKNVISLQALVFHFLLKLKVNESTFVLGSSVNWVRDG
jgi:hypothetical protein